VKADEPELSAELSSCRALIERVKERLDKDRVDLAEVDLATAEATALVAGLQRLRSLRARAEPEPSSLPVVLVVEDQEDNRIIYRRTLRKHYDLIEVEDGASAVERARAIRPALIVMDISLPVMDGLEATRILKGDPRTSAIPIVLITAHAMKGNREEALASGANEYVTKPFSPARLREVIQRLIDG